MLGILFSAATAFTYLLSLSDVVNPPNWVRLTITLLGVLAFITLVVAFVGVRTSGHSRNAHEQYLAKNPLGYRCHANTGVRFPA